MNHQRGTDASVDAVRLDTQLVDTEDAALLVDSAALNEELHHFREQDENTIEVGNVSRPALVKNAKQPVTVAKTTAAQQKRLSVLVVLSGVSFAFILVAIGGVLLMNSKGNITASEVLATSAPSTIAPTTLSPTASEVLATSAPSTIVPTTMSPTAAAPVTSAPTGSPTSSPTEAPTSAPTIENVVVPVNPVPARRPRSYFNYNEDDRQFGPRNWRGINMHGTYFQEFGTNGFGPWKGHMQDHVANTTINRCGVSGKQSPIDLVQTSGEESECTATHQIRTRVSVAFLV